MSSWEPSRTLGRRHSDDSGASTSFDDTTQEDQWKALREEVLNECGSDEEDAIPASGELTFPRLPLQKTKSAKKAAKKAAPPPKQAIQKPRQKTLAQAMGDSDVSQFLRKAREIDEAEDGREGDVDYSRFLEDDDGDEGVDNDERHDGGGADSEEEDSPSAAKLLSILTASTKVAQSAPPAAREEKGKREDDAAPATVPIVRLENEEYNYKTDAQGDFDAKHRKKPSVSAPTSHGSGSPNKGSSYLTVEAPQAQVELAEKLAAPSVKAEPCTRQSDLTGGSAGPFYWFDAKEQPHTLSVAPGSLFLFGRILIEKNGRQRYASCCVHVQNMERCVHLLPQSGSSEEDVVKEINSMCRHQGIEQRRIKFEEKYYAFEEPGIPHERTTWATLRYPARFPPFSFKGEMKHIRAVLGASTSLLELFLIEGKVQGPCFLRVANAVPATSRVSHCDAEFVVDSPRSVTVDETARPPPPFTVASIQIHAQLDAKGANNEVFAASIAVYRDTNVDGSVRTIPNEVLTGIRQLTPNTALPLELESYCNSHGFPGVNRFPNERKLLIWLAATLGSIDPDIIVGHNFLGFTLDTLLRRFQELSVPGWSTLGRLDLRRFPRLQGSAAGNLNQEKETCIGRLVADSYLLSREYFKSVNYKLTALADEMHLQGIAKGKSAFEPGSSTLTPDTLASVQGLFDVLLQVANCAVLSAALVYHLDAIRLTKRLTTIAGNLWSRTLYGARSERIEYLLLHAFSGLDFILPDKRGLEFKRGRDDDEDGAGEGKRKAKYQGGMVLDPKCGLYTDYLLLLDFNSLYPSLIQEFNICYTTVDRATNEDVAIPPPENLICRSCAKEGLPSPCRHKCVLPKVIKSLVDSRREVKRLMKSEKDPNSLALLEIRQKALKLTANSMYGCLGFEHSRFHAQPLAELVTRQGRQALQNTVDLIPQINPVLRVIYGDTDSVMIQTGIKNDIKAVRDIGLELKAKINKNYQSLEIDIDGVFRAILLLKKKKYAAVSVVDWQGEGKVLKREVKGLDMVRRDWCPLSKKVSDAVLNRVLNADGGEDILGYLMNYMHDVAEHVRAGDRYTLEDFVISKSLTKEPEAYKGTAFPHATVAKRMKERKLLVRVGDLIPYVICDGDKLTEKAYHVDEVRGSKDLHIDAEWYLSAQVYPPVMRLCEHIQGFSNAHLSEAMGIAYHQSPKGAENDDDDENGSTNRSEDFAHCTMFKRSDLAECFPTAIPLQVQCPYCLRKSPVDPHKRVREVVEANPNSAEAFDLYVCPSCCRSLPVALVANSFTQMCYTLLRQFYQSGGRAAAVRAVRTQFTFFRALFDVPHAPGCPPGIKDAHSHRARRCLGMNGGLYTLAEAAQPDVKAESDPVDPLNAAAESFYRRVDNLFIDLDSLFC